MKGMKAIHIFYLPFTLLQQSGFGIIQAGRFYRPLKNIGIRTSITSDSTVNGIVV